MKRVWGYLVILLILGFTTNLFAVETTIKKINKDKKTVVIKGTEADGFVKDNKVCFYNPVNSKKVACGTIRKNGKATSLVSVAAAAITRISKNFIVSTSQEKVLGVTLANKKNKEGLGGDVQIGEGGGESEVILVSPFRIELSYLYAILIPTRSNSLGYDTIYPKDALQSRDNLWNNAETMNSSPFSIAATFAYHINRLFSVSLGLDYTFLYPAYVKADYTNKNADKSQIFINESASILGIFSDFTAYRYYLGPNNSNFYASLGLSFDMFSLSFEAKKHPIINGIEGEEQDLANIDAKLNLFAFRFGTGYEFYIKENLGFIAGVIATVPVAGSPSYSGTSNDEQASYLKEGIDVSDDIYNNLDVKKAFGVSVSLSSFVQF